MNYMKYLFLLLFTLSSCLMLPSTKIKAPTSEEMKPLFVEHVQPAIDQSPLQIKIPPADHHSINTRIINIERHSSLKVSDAPITSALTIGQDIVIFAGNGVLSRVSKTGNQLWSKNFISDKKYGSVLYVDGVIVVFTGTTKLYGVDADNGNTIWEKYLKSPVHSHGTNMHTPYFLVVTIDNSFHAINAKDGEIEWSYQATKPSLQRINNQKPVYYKDKIILPPIENELIALDAMSGNKVWSVDLNDKYQQSFFYGAYDIPIVINESVLSSNYSGEIEAFDIESGTKQWQQYISIRSAPFILDKVIFALTEDSHLIALTSDGKLKWRTPVEGKAHCYGPILLNSLLWVFNDQGKAYGYKVQNGERVDSIDIPTHLSYQPFVLGGLAYSFDKNGKLLIIGKK